MIRIGELKLKLDQAAAPAPELQAVLRQAAAAAMGVPTDAVEQLTVFKRSFDARQRDLQVVFIVDAALSEPGQESRVLQRLQGRAHIGPTPAMGWTPPVLPRRAEGDLRPVVIGFGPCGIFAALCLAQMGLSPIVLERGKPVRERTQDTWGLWRRGVLNPESNVQFGEGGAGTFSDGKLYSQIRDPRHLGRKVLEDFVAAGAPEDILTDAHPHIGTFRLVKMVENLRERITQLGGEIRFQHKVQALLLAPDAASGHQRVQGLRVLDQARGVESDLACEHVVLAVGHSARDTFLALHRSGVAIEAKAFSIGARIEHPQSLIDQARWGRHAGHPLLGAADYKLVHHASNGRTAYSFCMCPGGTVVAATSEPGHVLTNGMSQYSRQERNANAGFVVGIEPSDFPRGDDLATWQAAFGERDGAVLAAEALALPQGQTHPLAGIVLQRAYERAAFVAGGGDYRAPAQLLGDFMAGRPSVGLGEVQPSYQPGVVPGDLAALLPDEVVATLREAIPAFARKIRGYDLPDAVLTGLETRTSAPLRIPRDESGQSINTPGLFPAGEGAGYAGGILSAGVDGIRVAEAVARDCLHTAPIAGH